MKPQGLSFVRPILSVASVLFLIVAGCASKDNAHLREVGDSRQNLNQIFRAYKMATKELKHPPKNADELKPFFEKSGGSSDCLRTATGEEPYTIIWGASLTAPAMDKKNTPAAPGGSPIPPWPILAYEKEGETRLVLFVTGPVMELNQADFRQANFAKGHTPR